MSGCGLLHVVDQHRAASTVNYATGQWMQSRSTRAWACAPTCLRFWPRWWQDLAHQNFVNGTNVDLCYSEGLEVPTGGVHILPGNGSLKYYHSKKVSTITFNSQLSFQQGSRKAKSTRNSPLTSGPKASWCPMAVSDRIVPIPTILNLSGGWRQLALDVSQADYCRQKQ